MALATATSNGQKGFVYTLEAVIAATLFLGMVIVVIPDIQPDRPSRTLQDTVENALETIDKTSDLDNMTREEIDTELDSFVPAGQNYSVRIAEVKTETRTVEAPEEFDFDKEGNHTEIQLWIDSADNLDATFAGEQVLDSYSSSGYELRTVSSTSGTLDFTGSSNLTFDFDVYSYSGSLPDQKNTKAVNYVTGEREVQVFLWNQ